MAGGTAVRQIHLGELAGDANGVEHGEGAVPEPLHPIRDREAALLQGEEGVPDHLGRCPSREHGRVERADRHLGEGVGDAPYDGKAAEDLEEGGEDRRRDNACETQKRSDRSPEVLV